MAADLRSELWRMPKVELHVHMEGSIRPATVLKLAQKNGVSLPSDTVEGLQEWYTFRDFPHFVEVYLGISNCIRSAEDVELIGREFLESQAEQNILHSEVTYTASTMEKHMGIPMKDQLDALRRAIAYGREELGISMSLILDIVRGHSMEWAMRTTRAALEARDIVCALGLAGEERLGTLEYMPCFKLAREEKLPIVAHAGETCGPEVIWDCLEIRACRIGHGVRCLEDPALVSELRAQGIPLEVCPSSNVCLGVFPSWTEHPFQKLRDSWLYVTLNSDDPPMFNTTLTDEYLRACETFGLTLEDCRGLASSAAHWSLLPESQRTALKETIAAHAFDASGCQP